LLGGKIQPPQMKSLQQDELHDASGVSDRKASCRKCFDKNPFQYVHTKIQKLRLNMGANMVTGTLPFRELNPEFSISWNHWKYSDLRKS
jgi:hypothetical protein